MDISNRGKEVGKIDGNSCLWNLYYVNEFYNFNDLKVGPVRSVKDEK